MAGQGESESSKRKVQAVERQRQAMEMRLEGYTYEQIAEALGYGGPSGAYKAIITAMDKTIRDPADRLRQMELDKLDRLEQTWMPLAKSGSKDGADVIMKIQARRARLLGLDAPEQSVTQISMPAVDEILREVLANPAARLAACALAEAMGQTEETAGEAANEQSNSSDRLSNASVRPSGGNDQAGAEQGRY